LEQKDTKETKNSQGKQRRDSLNVGASHRCGKRKRRPRPFLLHSTFQPLAHSQEFGDSLFCAQ
jgi:hypothetical protein